MGATWVLEAREIYEEIISNIRASLMIERHLILFEGVLQVGDTSTTRLVRID